jgi:hypothetical protein
MAISGIVAACVLIVVGANATLLLLHPPFGLYFLRWTRFSSNKCDRLSNPLTFYGWESILRADMYKGVMPLVGLLIFRCFCCLYFFLEVMWQNFGPWRASGGGGASWLSFFTNWTFCLFFLSAVFGSIASGIEIISRAKESRKIKDVEASSEPSRENLKAWSWIEALWYQIFITVLCSSMALTVFYWATLYDGSVIYIDNVMRHGGSLILLLVELLITRIPVFSFAFHSVIIYPSVYCVFMWLYYAGSNNWVYSSLDFGMVLSPAYYLALLVLLLISFGVSYGFAVAREKLYAKASRTAVNIEDSSIVDT